MLQDLWETVLDGNIEPNFRVRVIGVLAEKESFDYYFSISVDELVLSHGNNLSAVVQRNTISALKVSA